MRSLRCRRLKNAKVRDAGDPKTVRNKHKMKRIKIISNGSHSANGLNGRKIIYKKKLTLQSGPSPSQEFHPWLADSFKDLPVMGYINQHSGLRVKQPFEGLAVVAMLHPYPNCIATVKTWLDFGCDPQNGFLFFIDGYGYAADDSWR